MVYKTQALALLGATENIIKYNNLYDQWIVTSNIEACIVHKYPDLDHNPNRLAGSLVETYLTCIG